MTRRAVELFRVALTYSWVHLFVALQVPASVVWSRDVDSMLGRRFRQEAPKCWEEYIEKSKRLQGSFIFRFSGSSNNTKGQNRYELSFNSHGKSIAISMQRTTGQKSDYDTHAVLGINANYAFVLKRKTPEDNWLPTEIHNLRGLNAPYHIERHFIDFGVNVAGLVHIRSDSLLDLVRQPEFKIIRCRQVDEAGEDLVEVVFEYPHEYMQSSEKQSSQVQGGTLILDSRRFWCLRSYDVRSHTPGSRGSIKYRVLELANERSAIPIPKRAISDAEFVFDGGKNHQVCQFDYDLSEPVDLRSDTSFTLSAFGLPEPDNIHEAIGNWYSRWYVVAAAAAFCVGAGIVVRRVRQA